MTAIMNKTMERSKLLAAIAVLALVVCAFVAIMPASEVQGATTQVAAPGAGQDTLQSAIDAAQPGDILVLAAGTYTPVDGVYDITKNITIRAADAEEKPTIDGSFLVNANNATFENLIITPNGGTGAERNGITFLGVNLTVTNVEFTADETAFSNAISFWPATTNANLNVTGSVFDGFNTISEGYSSSAIAYAVNLSVASYFPDYTENNGLSAIITTTEAQLLSIYENNEFTGCVNAIAFHNWGAAENTEDSGYYVVNEQFNGQSNMTTIIPEGSEITLADDSMEEKNETIINYGTIIVPNTLTSPNQGKNTITNNGTVIIENVDIPGTIDGGNVIVNFVQSGEDPVTINYPNMTSGTKLSVQQVTSFDESGEATGAAQNYTTVLVELTGDKTAIIGIDSVYYSDKDYAGEGGNVGVRILSSNVTGSGDTLGFLGMNVVYETRDAAENQGETGEAKNAGTYYIRMNLQTYIGGVYATVPVIGEFEILPLEAEDVQIEWTTENGSAPEKAYTGSPITLDDSEYNVVVTIDGEEIVFAPGQYTVSYSNNTVPGEEAVISVVLNGNYAGNATNKFTISDMYINLEIENTKDTYYVGESIDTDALTVTGITDYGTETILTPKTDDVNGYVLNPETLMTSGDVTVTVSYTVDEVTISGTFTITVIGVAGIEIAKDPNTIEYNAGDAIDTAGMEVEVTYEDETVVTFTDSDGNGLIANGESEVDDNFVFTPEAGVGDISVEVEYFGATDSFAVTINGYGLIYMVGTEIYGSQVRSSESDSEAVIFNYYGTSQNGQQFTGWRIEGTNSIYQPGSSIVFGEDKNMWGDGTENVNVYLIAQFGGSSGTIDQPTEASADVIVGVYYDESTHGRVIVTLTAMDGGYIPAGSVTISGNYTYMVDVPGLGPMPQTTPYSAVLPVEEGQNIIVFDVDDTENDFSFVSGIISLTANYTSGDMSDVSNYMTYTFVAPTTEA